MNKPMKCDLCGEEMKNLGRCGETSNSWWCKPCNERIELKEGQSYTYQVIANENDDRIVLVIYQSKHYTPDEWQRLLKLKAFL